MNRPNIESILFWAFLALLLWIPIPLGSNRPLWWMVLEVWVLAVLFGWILAWTFGAIKVSDSLLKSWPAWVLMALWLLLQWAHIVPMPASWVEVLNPEAFRMQSLVRDIGIEPERMTLSVDSGASTISLSKTLAYASVFFLTLALCNRRSRIHTLARVLVYAGVVQAIYAVLMHLGGVSEEWFGYFIPHGESASGTYANRNHLAGYLEMTSAVGIGLLIASLSDRKADSWKKWMKHAIEWILSPKMILRLSLCILVIALTTTHSRMGNTAFFSALLVAGILGIVLSRRATRNTVILLASLIAIDLFIVGSWFGVEKLAQRLEQTTIEDVQEREDPAAHTIPLIKDYPVFGAGPGSFYSVFPRYRTEKVVLFYDYAHNDYAQIAAESGLLGLAILGLFVALSLIMALRAQWQRRDPLMRGMSFACVMGVTAILIHSWVDFNLQIPANASHFMVLLALGWLALFHDRHVPGIANVRAALP